MDDGGKLDYNKNSKNKGVVLNTQSFEDKEVEAMAQQLSDKFDLDCEVRANKGKKVIVIKAASYSAERFLSLIDPYILRTSHLRWVRSLCPPLPAFPPHNMGGAGGGCGERDINYLNNYIGQDEDIVWAISWGMEVRD